MSLLPPAKGRLGRLTGALGALLLLAAATFGALWWSLPAPAEWSTRNPPTTALIEQRRAEAAAKGRPYRPDQRWLPFGRISRRLTEAVVASEDAKFWDHGGFDWAALEDATRQNLKERRYARGASTITQQVAKNLWLGTEKSLVRKAREALLAARLERKLGKRRILELYLNVAEWGDGIFGVEAAARHHLGVGAGELSTAQAVLLASMLPAPRRADLARPAPWLVARSVGLLERLHAEKALGDEEHATARAELAGLLGLTRPSAAEAASTPPGSGGADLAEPPADDAPEPPPAEAPAAVPTAPAAEAPTAPPPPGVATPAPSGPIDAAEPPATAAPAPPPRSPAQPTPAPAGPSTSPKDAP